MEKQGFSSRSILVLEFIVVRDLDLYVIFLI